MSEVQRLSLDMTYPFTYMENNEGNLCYYADYAALKAERDALAGENASLKVACLSLAGECAQAAGEAEQTMQSIKTPATEAYLNAVRAEGTITILSELLEEISATGKSASRWKLGFIDYAWAVVAEKRANYSNQLRAGKDGE